MGAAARRNPRSLEAPIDPEERALILLRDTVTQLRSRLAFERWLLTFEAPRSTIRTDADIVRDLEISAAIRAMLQSAGQWTIENRRKARLAREHQAAIIRVRARAISMEALGGGSRWPAMGVKVVE